MRLTRYTDYSLRVLMHLAESDGRLASIAEMADFHRVSRNHLMKVVHDLGKAGYIASVRGRSGGVRLARAPQHINVGEVVRTMEDGFALVDCLSCRMAQACGLRQALGEALAAFIRVLDGYTLFDLLSVEPGPLALFADDFASASPKELPCHKPL